MMVELAAKALPFLWLAVTFMFCGAVLTLPLAAFQRTRAFVVFILWLFTRILSITLWLWSSIVALVLWGWTAVIIGILILGVGVTPIAFLAAAFEGQWLVFIQMLVTLIVVIGSHLFANWLAEET